MQSLFNKIIINYNFIKWTPMPNPELQAINDLLEYAKKIGELNQKTIFKVEEYKKITIFENTLVNKQGNHFKVVKNEDGQNLWLGGSNIS